MTTGTSRKPVLLLHGQPGSGRDWDGVIAALDGRAAAIAIDRPGWDGHSAPSGLAANGDAALAELDRRGIDRAVIAGHSLGGAVAVRLAVVAPERVSALVLAAPAANLASLQAFDRWLTLPVAGLMTSATTLTGVGLALSARPVRDRLSRRSGLSDDYLRTSGRALLTRWARRAFAAEQRSLAAELRSLEPRLAEVVTPTWILSGRRDRVVSPAAARALADEIAGAQLLVLERAGHLLPQLHARRLADAIEVALDRGATG